MVIPKGNFLYLEAAANVLKVFRSRTLLTLPFLFTFLVLLRRESLKLR